MKVSSNSASGLSLGLPAVKKIASLVKKTRMNGPPYSDDVLQVVERMFKNIEDDDEVELRIGQWAGGRFVPGVDRETVGALIQKLDGCMTWSEQTRWEEMTDFYNGSTRLAVSYDEGSFEIQRQALIKQCSAKQLLPTDGKYHMRVSRAKEKRVDIQESFPTVFKPSHVRIKQRKSYTYKPQNCNSNGAWRYDLTMVWHGATKTEAEQWQRSEKPPVYEIEIEYVGGVEYARRVGARHLAASMLLKAIDLVQPATQIALMPPPSISAAATRFPVAQSQISR